MIRTKDKIRVTISGPQGVGKTTLAAAIAKMLCRYEIGERARFSYSKKSECVGPLVDGYMVTDKSEASSDFPLLSSEDAKVFKRAEIEIITQDEVDAAVRLQITAYACRNVWSCRSTDGLSGPGLLCRSCVRKETRTQKRKMR